MKTRATGFWILAALVLLACLSTSVVPRRTPTPVPPQEIVAPVDPTDRMLYEFERVLHDLSLREQRAAVYYCALVIEKIAKLQVAPLLFKEEADARWAMRVLAHNSSSLAHIARHSQLEELGDLFRKRAGIWTEAVVGRIDTATRDLRLAESDRDLHALREQEADTRRELRTMILADRVLTGIADEIVEKILANSRRAADVARSAE